MNEDLAEAAARAEARLARGEQKAEHYSTLGWYALVSGDGQRAFDLFQNALKIEPGDAESLTGLASLYRSVGQLRDAALHCDAAIEAAPHYAEAWLERGFVMAEAGDTGEASLCYRKVIELDERNAAALAGLASIFVRDGDLEGARVYAQRALAEDRYNVIATCALASCKIEAGNFEAVLSLLDPLIAAMPRASSDRAFAFGLAGEALDKLRRHKEAFHKYAQAKQDFEVIHADKFGGGRQTHREFIETVRSEFLAVDQELWQVTEPGNPKNAAANHIFLLGYPRSGTTLVENILASAPSVTALEEIPTLRTADTEFLTVEGGLARLAAAGATQLVGFRQAYWDKVQASGVGVSGKTFVDMDPLKGIRLPLIAKLFPEARIILMRRDPRDVVWSCFKTNFALTSAAYEFTSLERAARHYDALMQLTEDALERLPINVHILRYDRLVRDFDTEVQAMCEFAGISWSPELREFEKTAKARGVVTASASQVRRPLYDGTRQWKPYRDYFEPIMPVLKPWIEKFGFES